VLPNPSGEAPSLSCVRDIVPYCADRRSASIEGAIGNAVGSEWADATVMSTATQNELELAAGRGQLSTADRVRHLMLASLLVLTAACGGTDDHAEPAPDSAAPSTPPVSATDVPSVLPTVPSLTGLPPQPAGVPFPGDEWPISPPSATPDAVAPIVEEALVTGGRFGTIDAVLVVQGGAIVVEAYGDGWDPSRVHPSWSIAKSVTHALIGVLVQEDAFDIDQPAGIEEWESPGDPRSAITPRMLMQMTSGLQWDEPSDAFDLVTNTASVNAAHEQADRPLAAPPGTAFNYSTGSTAILGRMIGDLVGTGNEFARWSDAELFDPLGIDGVELTFDVDDYWVAGYGADMTARDSARFGLLYLRDGVWDGQRILPRGWVDNARTSTPLAPPYGSGFWIDVNAADTFSAEGFLGQKIVVVPDADLVVVVLAQNFDDDLSTQLAAALIEVFRVG
jgi:CubicO group peptidase (beta-lactamase class C family)